MNLNRLFAKIHKRDYLMPYHREWGGSIAAFHCKRPSTNARPSDWTWSERKKERKKEKMENFSWMSTVQIVRRQSRRFTPRPQLLKGVWSIFTRTYNKQKKKTGEEKPSVDTALRMFLCPQMQRYASISARKHLYCSAVSRLLSVVRRRVGEKRKGGGV